ncbi:kinesin-like protein KIN-14R isoform X3 [Telopea speciosissima]|uniref:kinesin-like protein KIN-14R isoform X3 n=1 Tax=Telopea speciosissima TaxID=54955 RepID=UPI001CC453DE|nr:kinesin-like protein KIN-14R isoform X3 [Telopea speciosissima]
MEEMRAYTSHRDPEAPISLSRDLDREQELPMVNSSFGNDDEPSSAGTQNCSVDDADPVDSMLCFWGSRLVHVGLERVNCTEDFVMFVNAGGGTLREEDANNIFKPDICFQGGDDFGTEESIIDGGDYPSIYQSARLGNFCYRFDNLPPGDYFVDLHFAEIINTNGPQGMRVFNVYVQEEKVLSELDIYSIVGSNRPLQLVDAKVSVGEDAAIVIRFEGVHGSPLVSGICIRRAPKSSDSQEKSEHLICKNCAADIEVPSDQKLIRMKSTTKYEKKIEELTTQCKLKTNECYEAWMSLTAANDQLQKVRMELDNKCFQTLSLDQAMKKQGTELRDVCSRYEQDKKFWIAAVNDLEGKLKILKQDHSKLSCEAHECADSIPELNQMVFAVRALVAQCEDLKVKYSEEQVQRKKLFNQIQDAKGNIRVFCRCRPLSKAEVSAGYATVADFDAAKDGELGILTGGAAKKTFKFDRVYTPKDDQAAVFADASPLVTSVLDGYNVCIFAYGQTGTGKTFTMEGIELNRGVNYRTLDQLFKIAKERNETFTYNISVSVLEVYNEQIRDLLATSPTSKKLEIRQASEGVHHVPGIVEAKVENIKEVWDVLQAGSNARAVGSNNVNEHSSRSHCMLCIMVRAKNLLNGESTKSKLWLVDLAGSERLAKTDVQGERLKEAQNINRSLSALGDVISALATKNSHIPYRNSKLTHLLQDSLGGESKTLMFVQISPSEYDLGETLSSLNFATRVRGIELGPAKKQIDAGELQKLKMLLEKAKQESRSKDDSLRKLQDDIQNLENKATSKDHLCKSQHEKVKELENQLELKIELHSQMEKQCRHLVEIMKGSEETCMALQQKVKELENKLKERERMESLSLQQKVKDLEDKLKERDLQFESNSMTLRRKVKELESKLREQEQNSESVYLQQKVKEVEDKLKEREQQVESMIYKLKEREQQVESMLLLSSTSKSGAASPNQGKAMSREESMCETDPMILRSSSSINRAMNQESVLLRGTESLREIRRKRDIRSGETENIYFQPNPSLEKKIVPTVVGRVRKIDPVKPLTRVVRTTKPVNTAPKMFSHGRINRDQVQGIKEKDKTRGWSR